MINQCTVQYGYNGHHRHQNVDSNIKYQIFTGPEGESTTISVKILYETMVYIFFYSVALLSYSLSMIFFKLTVSSVVL